MTIDWIDENGTRHQENLYEVLSSVDLIRDKDKLQRTAELMDLFQATYHAAIQAGAGIIDAIAKAKDAVKAAGMYDAAMKESVEARIALEFPQDQPLGFINE